MKIPKIRRYLNRLLKMSSSAVICQNFVQNTWKKELCSNCFKSKSEHQNLKVVVSVKTEMASSKSIMRTRKSSKLKPKRTVCFPNDLTQVIGYGGEDWYCSNGEDGADAEDEHSDSDDENGFGTTTESEDDLDDAGRDLRRLTKLNTDFNTTALKTPNGPARKLINSKPIIEPSARKLFVSITPYGEDQPKKYLSTKSLTNKHSIITDSKPTVILKSYMNKTDEDHLDSGLRQEKSLLDEITETLENNRNPILLKANKSDAGEMVKKSVSLTRTPALKREMHEKPVISVSVKSKEVAEFAQSRELAGEPDGRADSDTSNTTDPLPPALPTTPPPSLFEIQNSYLHSTSSPTYDRPKVPTKPTNTVLIKKSSPPNMVEVKNLVLTSFGTTTSEPNKINKSELQIGPLNTHHHTTNSNNNNSKRKAPQPPSSALKLALDEDYAEEPVLPQKSLSISTDSLNGLCSLDDKRTLKTKCRFSLKKFLRMGTGNRDSLKIGDILARNLDSGGDENTSLTSTGAPKPKPRLVIVHPLDLNGSGVKIVNSTSAGGIAHDYQNISTQLEKPPPPPRNFNQSETGVINNKKKAASVCNEPMKMQQINIKETVYANIGEVRSSITPHKPHRTSSMRERENQQLLLNKKKSTVAVVDHVYDYIVHTNNSDASSTDSSGGTPSVKKDAGKRSAASKRCGSQTDVSSVEYLGKYQNMPRSMSLTYCGSETESEIYSPYSLCGGGGSESEVADDEDWSGASPPTNSSTNKSGVGVSTGRGVQKLRSRKGRSVVHKNLEDNYGAVVVANHEALAQVLENILQTNCIPMVLRGLKTVSNLRWTDFVLKPPGSQKPLTVGNQVFHQALWGTHLVTLMVTNSRKVCPNALSLVPFNLNPLTEFNDLIPAEFLIPSNCSTAEKNVQATISVLSWNHVTTINEVLLQDERDETNNTKDAAFIMLQLVNALKVLQVHGIEELPISLNNFVLCKEMEKDSHYRLYIIQQGLGDDMNDDDSKTDNRVKMAADTSNHDGTLCSCAARAAAILQPLGKSNTTLLKTLLTTERAVSLTQVKSILEFCLWGPTDVVLGTTIRERELAIQRWLDLQRATVLHGLVCTKVQLTVYEECHLMFLVRTNAKMMSDASVLIDSGNANKKL